MTRKELADTVDPFIDQYRVRNHITRKQAVQDLSKEIGTPQQRFELLTRSEWQESRRTKRWWQR